jgi:hypothetical protein
MDEVLLVALHPQETRTPRHRRTQAEKHPETESA